MSLRARWLMVVLCLALPASALGGGFDIAEGLGGSEDDNHLFIDFDDVCVGPGMLFYTGDLYTKCCDGNVPKVTTEAVCNGSPATVLGDMAERQVEPDKTVQASLDAIDGYNGNSPIANNKAPAPKNDVKEGSGGPIAFNAAAKDGGEFSGPGGLSGKDKSGTGSGNGGVSGARRGGSGSGFGGGSGSGGSGMNSGDIKTGVLGAEQAAATVAQEDPNAKYAGGAGGGAGGAGGRGPGGGFGFGGGGFGGAGGSGTSGELGFGAREDGASAMGSSDPDDYFTRMDLYANIFKVVEKRYRNKATDWAHQDAKGVTPGAPLH